MCRLGRFIAVSLIVCLGTSAFAETVTEVNGGDRFVAGAAVTETLDDTGDAFVAARTAAANGAVGGDLHVSGFDVSVGAETSEDLYAVGFSVEIRGSVAEDLTAAGFSIRTGPSSETEGNARLFGSSVTINGPVRGALTATGADIILNAEIAGDVRLVAGTISFGPDAKIGGALTYSSASEISIPERVVPADRVSFQRISPMDARDAWQDMRRDMPVLPSFMSMLFGFLVSLFFFLVLAAVMLTFMPLRLDSMSKQVTEAPGKSILLGVIGLSMLFGMVPITALTIVGLPFVPIVLLAIVVVWTLGYALGAYSIAMRLWTGFGDDEDPATIVRLVVFGGAITVIALLNFIPFVGWVVNYTLVLLGIGGIARVLFLSMLGNPSVALDVDMKRVDG